MDRVTLNFYAATRRVYDNNINDKNEEPVPTFHFNTMPRQQSQPQQKYTYSHDPFTGFQVKSIVTIATIS